MGSGTYRAILVINSAYGSIPGSLGMASLAT